MVKIPTEVNGFLHRVKKKFAPKKIYLFGSRAAGKAAPESDWDFIIVSEKFKSVVDYKRAVEVYRLSNGEFAFDVLCFTPEEFESKKMEPSLIRKCLHEKNLVEIAV